MWAALNDIAVERGKTVHDVILEINRDRKGISLTAAIRVYIVEYYREALRGCRTEKAPPSPAGLTPYTARSAGPYRREHV